MLLRSPPPLPYLWLSNREHVPQSRFPFCPRLLHDRLYPRSVCADAHVLIFTGGHPLLPCLPGERSSSVAAVPSPPKARNTHHHVCLPERKFQGPFFQIYTLYPEVYVDFQDCKFDCPRPGAILFLGITTSPPCFLLFHFLYFIELCNSAALFSALFKIFLV